MSFFRKNNSKQTAEIDAGETYSPAQLAAKAKELRLKGRRLSMQLFSGENKSSFQGRGMAFKEVREYQAGDDVRFIDWNVSARMGHTYSKVFEEDRELSFFLLVDVSASNLFGTLTQSKKDQIANLCSVLAFAAISNNDKVGALFFSDKIEKFFPSKKSPDHALYLVREILGFQPVSAGTNIESALQYLNGAVKQRSIVFVISDFVGNDFHDALRIAARRHEVIGIQVYDKSERTLPRVGLLDVKDAETGRTVWLDTDDAYARRMYQEQFDRNKEEVQDFFRKAGAGLIQVATDGDYIKVLKEFFKRSA